MTAHALSSAQYAAPSALSWCPILHMMDMHMRFLQYGSKPLHAASEVGAAVGAKTRPAVLQVGANHHPDLLSRRMSLAAAEQCSSACGHASKLVLAA